MLGMIENLRDPEVYFFFYTFVDGYLENIGSYVTDKSTLYQYKPYNDFFEEIRTEYRLWFA